VIVLRNSTTSLISYPRVDAGTMPLLAPTAASVRIATGSTAWPDETTGYTSAAVDTLDIAITSPSDDGAADVYVGSAASVVVGRDYLLVDEDAAHVVTVEAKDGSRVFLAGPLPRAVSDSARLVGWAVTAALSTEQTSIVGPAVAQWRCTIGGVAVSWTSAFRVARRMATIPLTAAELVRVYPEVRTLVARIDTTGEQLVLAAWEHIILPRILRRDVFPEDIVNPDVLKPLLAIACLLHAARQSRQVDAAYVDRWSTEFDRLFDNTVARIDFHVEPQEPTIALEPSPAQRAERFTRLVR
jgi:hypothetical protein